jgi:hypothetical protein
VKTTDGTRLIRPQRLLFDDAEAPLGLNEYQQATTLTDRNDRAGIDGLGFVLLLSALKKKQRDKDAYVAYHDTVIEELGDVLWYFANAALRAGIDLSALAQRVTATLADWDYHGRSGPVTFADLQKALKDFAGPLASDAVQQRLLALARLPRAAPAQSR